MSYLAQAIIAALVVSLISLIGIFFLLKRKLISRTIFFLISFAAGGMLGGAFFHLIPEALAPESETEKIFVWVVTGMVIFFILEKVLRWHHCHEQNCEADKLKHLGYLNLIGDGVHNLIDGLVIVSAFAANPGLGVVVSFSIALHEIPQEIGDLGVIMYAGFRARTALLYNLLSAFLSLIGVLAGYFLIHYVPSFNQVLLPLAAGGFIYIAAVDLVPELHKELNLKKSLLLFLFFILALVIMFFSAH
ncbi:MAG TPA: ZIP family metal transporter [bacterium]|nr:ZIP family metal transporter [bacterium]